MKQNERLTKTISQLKPDSVFQDLLAKLKSDVAASVEGTVQKEGVRLRAQGKLNDAIALLEKIYAIFPQAGIRDHLCVFYCDAASEFMAARRFAEARDQFSRALKLNPKHQRARTGMGTAYNNEATPAEVHQALPRFMRDRKNAPRLGKAQEAVRKLKAPAERAGIDIWFYQIDMPEASGGGVAEDFPLGDYTKPKLIPLENAYVGLNDEAREAEVPRVEFPPLAAPYLERYRWGEQREWHVRFDR